MDLGTLRSGSDCVDDQTTIRHLDETGTGSRLDECLYFGGFFSSTDWNEASGCLRKSLDALLPEI